MVEGSRGGNSQVKQGGGGELKREREWTPVDERLTGDIPGRYMQQDLGMQKLEEKREERQEGGNTREGEKSKMEGKGLEARRAGKAS